MCGTTGTTAISPAGTTEAGALETQTGGNSAAGACTFVIATT